jgi:hypothetical protein
MEKLGSSSQDSVQSGCTGLSGGAPDSVRCARLALVKRLLSGIRRRRTAIIHRTVRWANGRLRQWSAAQSARDAWPSQRSDGGTGLSSVYRTVRCAPDSVRCANGSKSSTVGYARIGKQSAPDSVRWCTRLCTTRQKARIAFLDCSQWILAALGL